MQKRTNTAKWNGTRWRIDVQKDGIRKSFYSSKKGRNGQREANKKADEWLEEDLISDIKICDLQEKMIEEKKEPLKDFEGPEYLRKSEAEISLENK